MSRSSGNKRLIMYLVTASFPHNILHNYCSAHSSHALWEQTDCLAPLWLLAALSRTTHPNNFKPHFLASPAIHLPSVKSNTCHKWKESKNKKKHSVAHLTGIWLTSHDSHQCNWKENDLALTNPGTANPHQSFCYRNYFYFIIPGMISFLWMEAGIQNGCWWGWFFRFDRHSYFAALMVIIHQGV